MIDLYKSLILIEGLTDPLYNLLAIQGSHGNWDYDPYMMGLYNGIELAASVLEKREPRYRSAPDVWGKAKK